MTSSESKKTVHQWRAEEDAILVGRVTVEKDNPSLTVREVKGNSPIRIVIDKELKLSSALNLFDRSAKTIIFNAKKTEVIDSNYFIKTDFKDLLNNILEELYKQNIQSIMIEGGSKTLQSFIDANMWDEARIFTTNKELNTGLKAPIIKGIILSKSYIYIDELKILTND
jgi:diaminohydroxyphosphoribosylaminopyrimidine deaminase/5-amino-6-(5-phosphoribosylamino)uracil reductase